MVFTKFFNTIFTYINDSLFTGLRFVLIGIVTFGINNGLFLLSFGYLKFDYNFSVSLSYFITVACHFYLNKNIAFQANEVRTLIAFPKYLMLLLLNYMITLSCMFLVVEVFHLSPYFGIPASTVLTLFTSFFIMNHFVFADFGDRN